jgi:phosphate transport system permease protein
MSTAPNLPLAKSVAVTTSTVSVEPQMPRNIGDRIFKGFTFVFASMVVLVAIFLIYEVYDGSKLSIAKFGFGFITGKVWDPVADEFGAFPFIYGTLLTSILALIIAVPISIGIAIYLVELAPNWIRFPLSLLIELLAAIPSIVYGFWGMYQFVPFMREYIEPILGKTMLPIFSGPILGMGILTASLILVIMVVPIVTAVTREVLLTVPDNNREAAIGLGATKWEMIRIAVLPYSKAGILGASILGLGRAFGETMAVTMVIGNSTRLPTSLFSTGYTMSSVIANEFAEATGDLYLSSLIEIGFILLIVALIVNAIARLLVYLTFRGVKARVA